MAAYPYPAKDANGHLKTYLAELPSLAETKPGTGFISTFNDVWAIDFDALTHDLCSWGRKEDWGSCDALYPDDVQNKNVVYFIEFKDRTLHTLCSQGADGKDETIEVELSKKIQDSLAVASMTCLRNCAMSDIQKKSEFIIVYNDVPPKDDEPKSYSDFTDDVAEWACIGKDRQNIRVLWELNRFKTTGFCRAVHTWSESQFKSYAKSFMIRQDGTSNF